MIPNRDRILEAIMIGKYPIVYEDIKHLLRQMEKDAHSPDVKYCGTVRILDVEYENLKYEDVSVEDGARVVRNFIDSLGYVVNTTPNDMKKIWTFHIYLGLA